MYIHEPWMENKLEYGIKRASMLIILEYLQKIYVKLSAHIVIVPSENARMKALKYGIFRDINLLYTFPLLLEKKGYKNKAKNYFLFIGRIHKAKSFESLLNTLEYNKEIILEIITTTNISTYLDQKHRDHIKSGRLIINSKKDIGETEIQAAIQKCSAVFKIDKLMTQSGIVPLSFALSTPVIARNIPGFSQDIDHKLDGYLINDSTDQELSLAINWINENLEIASLNARKKFNDKFSIDNWHKTWSQVL